MTDKTYEITIDNVVFELLYKITYNSTDCIVLTSKQTTETTKTKMVFYKSRSGLGMWHYCIIMKTWIFKVDDEYITGTFVHMALQQFINSNIDNISIKSNFDKGDLPTINNMGYTVVKNRVRDVCTSNLCTAFTTLYTFIGPDGINLQCGGIEKIPGIYRTKQREIDAFIMTHGLNNLHNTDKVLYEQDSLRREERKDSNTNLQELQAHYLLPYQYMMSIIYEYLKKYFKFEGTEQLYYTYEHSIITTTISIDIYQCIIYSDINKEYYYYYIKYNHDGTIYYAPLFITPILSKINNYGMYDCYMRSSIYFCKIYEYYGQLYGGPRKIPPVDYVFIGHLISEYTLLPPFNLGALYMEVDKCKVWFVQSDKLSELLVKKGNKNILAEYIVTFEDKDKINFSYLGDLISTTYSGDIPYDVTICGLLVKNLPNLRNGRRANMGKTILGNHPHIYCTFYQADPLNKGDLNKVIFYKDINDFNMFLYTNCLSIDKQTILTLNDFKISISTKKIGQNITHEYLGAGENIGDIPLNDTTTWLKLVSSIDNRSEMNKKMNNTRPENLDLKIKEEAEAEAKKKANAEAQAAQAQAAAEAAQNAAEAEAQAAAEAAANAEKAVFIKQFKKKKVNAEVKKKVNAEVKKKAEAEANAEATARAAARAVKAAAEKNEAKKMNHYGGRIKHANTNDEAMYPNMFFTYDNTSILLYSNVRNKVPTGLDYNNYTFTFNDDNEISIIKPSTGDNIYILQCDNLSIYNKIKRLYKKATEAKATEIKKQSFVNRAKLYIRSKGKPTQRRQKSLARGKERAANELNSDIARRARATNTQVSQTHRKSRKATGK